MFKELMIIGVLLFSLGMGVLINHHVGTTFVAYMQNNSQVNSSNATMEVLYASDANADKLDYFYFGVFIAIAIGVIIIGYVAAGHPILTFVYLVVMILSVVLAAVFANTWETVSTTSALATSTASLPLVNHLMLKLPSYVAIISAIGLVALFLRYRVEAKTR